MDHIAIDLGGRESQICVRSQDGSIIDERRCATGTLSRYLQRRPAGRVVVETCAEAFSVADEAVAAGHEVKVVPATLVRVLGVGSRGVKTDRRDAQILSEVSCRIELPSVHVPAAITRDRRSQCTSRENLVQTRTSLINGARGWLRQQLLRSEPNVRARCRISVLVCPPSGVVPKFRSRRGGCRRERNDAWLDGEGGGPRMAAGEFCLTLR